MFNILLNLINEMTVMITVIAILVSSLDYFKEVVVDEKFTYKNQIIMIIIFGTFSIFGSYSGTKLESGAIANLRDIGPLVAGLLGGPVIGFGAGLIGGIVRYFGGGFTALPCAIATISAGLIGGLFYNFNDKKFIGPQKAILIAVLVELYHMGITLILAKPFSEALEVVKILIIPMIFSNSMGVGIFSVIIGSLIQDKQKIKHLEEELENIASEEKI